MTPCASSSSSTSTAPSCSPPAPGRRAIVAALARGGRPQRRVRPDPVRRQDRSPDRGRDARGGGAARSRANRPGSSALCERYVDLLARELERPTTRTTLMPGVHALLDRLEARAPASCSACSPATWREGAALKLRSGGIAPERVPGRRLRLRRGPPARPARRSPRAGPSRLRPGARAAPRSSSSATRRPTSPAARASRPARSRSPPAPTRSADLAACGPHAVFEDLARHRRGGGRDPRVSGRSPRHAGGARAQGRHSRSRGAARPPARRAGAIAGFRGRMTDRRYDRARRARGPRRGAARAHLPPSRRRHRVGARLEGCQRSRSPEGYKQRAGDRAGRAERARRGGRGCSRRAGLRRRCTPIDRDVEIYRVDGATVRLERYPRMDPLVEVEGEPDAIERAIGVTGIRPRAPSPPIR